MPVEAAPTPGSPGFAEHEQSQEKQRAAEDKRRRDLAEARQAAEEANALAEELGEGVHRGEWWGNGIQRGYGLQNGDKRFSLFNVHRWEGLEADSVPGLGVVPVLWRGPFDTINVRVEGADDTQKLTFEATSKNEAKALAGVGGEADPKGESKGS